MKLLLDENLSRRLVMNQSRAATLKVLVENSGAIDEALVGNDLASVEIVPA